MKKIDSAFLVCTAEQSQQLIGLGIIPAGAFCYEYRVDDYSDDDGERGFYEYAGEYTGQPGVIPAWTYEELCVMIGGEYAKPDILSINDFTPNLDLMQYVLYMSNARYHFANGARAAAAMLEYGLINKKLTADECNERYDKFYSKESLNNNV